MLRPLAANDFREWSEVRRRNARLADRVGAEPSDPSSRPRDRPRSRSRRAANSVTATASNGSAYQFGMFLDQHVAGEVNLNNVIRGAMQSGTIGYWIDQAKPATSYIAEAVVVVLQFAFEQLVLHRVEICIVPRNERSRRVDGEAPDPRRRHRAAIPGDQRRVGGPHPLRHDGRGVARTAPRTPAELGRTAADLV